MWYGVEKTRGCTMDKNLQCFLIGAVLKGLRSAGCGGTVEEEVGIELCQGWETKWCYPLSKVALTWIIMAEDDEKNVDCAVGDVSAGFGIEDCLGWSDVRGQCGEDDLVYTTVVSRFSSFPFLYLRLHAWNTVIHLPKHWLQMEVRMKQLVQREGKKSKKLNGWMSITHSWTSKTLANPWAQMIAHSLSVSTTVLLYINYFCNNCRVKRVHLFGFLHSSV